MSTRIMAFSEPNMASASALLNSVLPTPVGPKNRKEPMGRLGSFKPTRPLRMALDTAVTASSWPTTRSCKIDSSFFRRCASPSSRDFTGIRVQSAITSAISLSPTTGRFNVFSRSQRALILSIFSRFFSCFRLISPAFS